MQTILLLVVVLEVKKQVLVPGNQTISTIMNQEHVGTIMNREYEMIIKIPTMLEESLNWLQDKNKDGGIFKIGLMQVEWILTFQKLPQQNFENTVVQSLC